MLLALFLGVLAGTIAAVKQNSHTDHATMFLAMTGISVPNFVCDGAYTYFSICSHVRLVARRGLEWRSIKEHGASRYCFSTSTNCIYISFNTRQHGRSFT